MTKSSQRLVLLAQATGQESALVLKKGVVRGY